MKEIKIKPANNGWIVEIGCQTFVAENKEKMLNEIGRYIDKPDEVEKEYTENPKNKCGNSLSDVVSFTQGGFVERVAE